MKFIRNNKHLVFGIIFGLLLTLMPIYFVFININTDSSNEENKSGLTIDLDENQLVYANDSEYTCAFALENHIINKWTGNKYSELDPKISLELNQDSSFKLSYKLSENNYEFNGRWEIIKVMPEISSSDREINLYFEENIQKRFEEIEKYSDNQIFEDIKDNLINTRTINFTIIYTEKDVDNLDECNNSGYRLALTQSEFLTIQNSQETEEFGETLSRVEQPNNYSFDGFRNNQISEISKCSELADEIYLGYWTWLPSYSDREIQQLEIKEDGTYILDVNGRYEGNWEYLEEENIIRLEFKDEDLIEERKEIEDGYYTAFNQNFKDDNYLDFPIQFNEEDYSNREFKECKIDSYYIQNGYIILYKTPRRVQI